MKVPSWVNWVAQDGSGTWWGYSAEPLRNDSGWYENEVGDCIPLAHAESANWEGSLRPVSSKGESSGNLALYCRDTENRGYEE